MSTVPRPVNRSHTKAQSDEVEWAKDAVKHVVASCCLNISLVEAGLFPSYFSEMESDAELAQYRSFLIALHESRAAFLRLREKR
jgi:hypothetical protein